MAGQTAVIVMAGTAGLPLVATVDSVARQGPKGEIFIAAPAPESEMPLAPSVTARHGARWVCGRERSLGAAVNEAARLARLPFLFIAATGFRLPAGFLDACEARLEADDRLQAVLPPVLLQTADGRGRQLWWPEAVQPETALADPLGVPPVLCVRRAIWQAVGGFDPALTSLAVFDLWLRLLLVKHPVHLAADLPVIRIAEDAGPEPPGASYLQEFQTVLARHRRAIEGRASAVFVAQEVHYSRLRDRHARLVAKRDEDLAELDRIRAECAHHRAYLEHHQAAGLDWGDLRRTDPVSRNWGYDRGAPVDRYHIEAFLAEHSSDIRGDVLEIQEDDFTRTFGGPRVDQASVLDTDARNPRATVVADLRHAPELPSDRFDCVLLTQTLHVIDDMSAVLRECHRILKPGGVLLATVPAASRVCLEYGTDGDLWRMTPAGARALTAGVFGDDRVSCRAYGNVLTNVAFLYGLAGHELTDGERERVDPYFPALTGVRACKSGASAGSPARRARPSRSARGAVLLYHRVDRVADVHGLSVAPDVFETHLAWLRSTCRVLPLEQMMSTPIERLPERAVALTFDDGYVDNLREAAPRLEQKGLPATFFVTTRWLDAIGEYWWDGLERMLLGDRLVPSVLEVVLPGTRTVTIEERRAAHDRLHELLVHASLTERDRAIAALAAWSGGGAARLRPMTADEIRELARRPGVVVGAHSVNHLCLPDQPAAVREQEVQESRSVLARLLAAPVDLFAYPYGAVTAEVAGGVRRMCRWSLTCDDRRLGESFDAACVPRFDVRAWSVDGLAARVDALFSSDMHDMQDMPRASSLLP
jgi:peptidoglycan/xylan/chitin deacetylase (PgdA/CDA1 family)